MIDWQLNVLETVNPTRQNRRGKDKKKEERKKEKKRKEGKKRKKMFKEREKYNNSKQCTGVKASINANHG